MHVRKGLYPILLMKEIYQQQQFVTHLNYCDQQKKWLSLKKSPSLPVKFVKSKIGAYFHEANEWLTPGKCLTHWGLVTPYGVEDIGQH